MPTVDERLASLEARIDRMNDLQNLIAALRDDMNRQFDQTRADTNQLRADMVRQFDQMNSHMTARLEQLDHRIDTVDRKADRHFTWLVGLQMTVMLAVIGALLGAYLR